MIKGEARGVAKYSRRHVEKIGWDLNEHFAYFLHNVRYIPLFGLTFESKD